MHKSVVLLALPLLTLFGPMIFFNASKDWSHLTASFPSGEELKPGNDAGAFGVFDSKASLSDAESSSDLAPVYDLGNVLRFDISPDWVVDRWPRVSSGLAQLQLQGYRVPLVTGIQPDDLAGSLTYYFNPHQQVQRITFHGTTGESGKLVAWLTSVYGFERRMTDDPGVFLYEVLDRNGNPASSLWIRPASVVKASESLGRYDVALLMERPEPGSRQW